MLCVGRIHRDGQPHACAPGLTAQLLSLSSAATFAVVLELEQCQDTQVTRPTDSCCSKTRVLVGTVSRHQKPVVSVPMRVA